MCNLIDNTCCFIGHRKIEASKDVENLIYNIAKDFIEKENINIFLFGSRSQFDSLCHKVVSDLKQIYPHIKRVYVRAEFPYINDDYKDYLLEDYEDTYYPEKVLNSGKAAYVERNHKMIDSSSICIVYYNPEYKPPRRKNSRRDLTDYQPKSGTAVAYEYALKCGKKIINTFHQD